MMTDIMIILAAKEIIRAEAPSFFSPFSDVNVFLSFVADDRVAPQLGGVGASSGASCAPSALRRRLAYQPVLLCQFSSVVYK